MDYGIIRKPENLTPEAEEIFNSYQNKIKEIENAHRKNTGRIWLGSALSGASALPVFNIPYVGTGLGGALYELGQGIAEGDKLPELAKRTGAGFAIGETVGAIPYIGKYANKLSGGKIGNALTAGVEKLASTPLGQKVTEIAPKVEDALMTDIKAFNPFKKTQTAYHGSPYDFNKFSNEAIGTGEGVQAHGYGHYAAKNKDVADIRYRKALSGTDGVYKYKDEILPEDFHLYYDAIKTGDIYTLPDILTQIDQEMRKTENLINRLKNNSVPLQEPKDLIDAQNLLSDYDKILTAVADFENVKLLESPKGQLYKLSIPKDDVMLREGATLAEQPKIVQKALNELYPNYIPNDTPLAGLFTRELFANQGTNRTKDEIKQAISDKLYSKGVKGISYNGGIDGEARVIFNPNDIEIVRKYYNQPELWDKFKGAIPNQGAGLLAIEDALRNFKFQRGSEEEKMYKSLGNNYRKNVLQHAPIYIPNEGIFEFTAHNAKKDLPLNYKQYPDIRQQILTSQKGFPTNTKGEKDRYYKHFLNTYNGDYYDYIFEALNDNRNVYKMTRKKGTSIVPYKKNTEVIPYDGQLTPSTERSLYNYIINNF